LINVNLLPKSLKRIREPGYWRVLAVAVPLVVGGVLFGVQYLTNQTIANLERDVQVREDQLALLQPFLEEQRELQSRQQALRSLIASPRRCAAVRSSGPPRSPRCSSTCPRAATRRGARSSTSAA
jgi:hypothetical protein